MKKIVSHAVMTLCLFATSSIAQPAPSDAPRRPPVPSERKSGGSGVEAQIRYLQDSYKLSEADARDRYETMLEIDKLIATARAEDPDAFAGVWVEHEPAFKVLVAFAGNDDRAAFASKVSPKLRRHLQLRKMRKSLAGSEEELATLFAALRAGGVDFTAAFEPTSQKYVVTVENDAGSGRLQGLVPSALRDLVQIRKGPVAHDVQSGVQTGDAVYGAWDALNASGYYECTFAFAGRNSNGRDSILTSAHCSTLNPRIQETGHLVTLPAAFDSRLEGDYDFRAHEVVGMSTGYWVYFVNSKPVRGYPSYVNTVPGFYSDGYFTVSATLKGNVIYNGNHYVGLPVCKSGSRTGFTCGTVTASSVNGTANGRAYTGMVRVGRSKQTVTAFSGDSGAPIFSWPDSGYNITAFGIMKAAEEHQETDGTILPCVNGQAYKGVVYDCGYFYMPIDRVNDRLPFQIHTTAGLVVP
jgi:hypothetical protein